MPYIEELLEAQEPMFWGQYHPRKKHKSMVMQRGIGCVFIGTVDQCQEYMAERERNPRKLLTR